MVIGARRLVWVPVPAHAETHSGAIEFEISPQPEETRQQALSRTLDELLAVLDSASLKSKPVSCTLQVLISDHWLALDVLPWSDALLRRDTAPAYLSDGFAMAGYEVATEDIVHIDDRRYGEPCWVVRYPDALLATLRYFADRTRCVLLGIQPLSTACIDLLRQRDGFTGTLGLLEGNWLRLFHVTKSSIRPLGHRQFIADPADASLICQRTCLCYPGLEAAHPLRLLNLSQQAIEETPQIQALQPAWLSSALATDQGDLLTGMACQAFNSTHPLAHHGLTKRRQVGQKLWIAFLVAAILSMAGAVGLVHSLIADQIQRPVTAQVALPDSSQLTAARDDDGNREAIRRLNFPVDELLRSLVPSDATLIWIVSVELDTDASLSATREIHLLGQTKGLDEVSAYMKALSARPHVGRIDLLRHEIVEIDPAKPLRFELEIAWQD
ncbi:MAG: hypothetical protein WBK19_20435 [Azonexus sp.]